MVEFTAAVSVWSDSTLLARQSGHIKRYAGGCTTQMFNPTNFKGTVSFVQAKRLSLKLFKANPKQKSNSDAISVNDHLNKGLFQNPTLLTASFYVNADGHFI